MTRRVAGLGLLAGVALLGLLLLGAVTVFLGLGVLLGTVAGSLLLVPVLLGAAGLYWVWRAARRSLETPPQSCHLPDSCDSSAQRATGRRPAGPVAALPEHAAG
ncbi:hypothetical protein ACFP81_05465 [Deinococcus lacus]|uniref:Uncharacterized protein n=1 Tax=Deinococcus lacus TaxID=392561 RepID=A0ABW1YF64_9DEIO